MYKYLNGEEIDVPTLRKVMRKAVIANAVVPVMLGSSFKNKGVQPLLDAVVEYMPSPVDLPPIKGMKPGTEEPMERHASDDEPFSSLAFKMHTDPLVGHLTFSRVYSPSLKTGS